MPPNEIEELRIPVDGVDTFYRRVRGEGVPTVFMHGNPTHSEDWIRFLPRIEGPAIAPDLPGWGRSERPRDFDYSMYGLAAFFERFLAAVGVDDQCDDDPPCDCAASASGDGRREVGAAGSST